MVHKSTYNASGGGGAVSSVSNSDGTLTVSPTTGDIVASIALNHANTWSGQQTFVAPILGTPASGVATNLTGTASSLTAGTVTTNANLTGDVTSSGNATTIALSVAHAWTGQQNFSAVTTNSSSNSTAWNLATAQFAKQAMTENTTLANPTNMVDGGTYTFRFVQNGSVAKTLAFGNAYIFSGNSTVNAALSSVTEYTFSCDGTSMRGVMTQWAS